MEDITRRGFLTLAGLGALALAGCSGSTGAESGSSASSESIVQEKQIPDLAGDWKQNNSNAEDSWMEASVADEAITVWWVSNNGDTKSLYWAGTYVAPTTADEPYTWESENDTSQTSTALMASSDATKEFAYQEDELSCKVTALGTTMTVRFTRE